MKLAASLILSAGCLAGCVAKAPSAHLEYLGMKPHGKEHYLHFKSDVHLFELFAKNKHQKVVLAELACALDDDHNLAFDNPLKHFATGRLESIGKNSNADGTKPYVFASLMFFWKSLDNTQTSNEYLNREQLAALFKDRKVIPCRVRMTVYLSSPYYSEVMLVPTKDILEVAEIGPPSGT